MKKKRNQEDAVLGPFFPSGYVIELGKGQYFRKWDKKRICCAPFLLARCFATEAAAKRYAERCFWYEGMEPHICQIRWYMTSWQENVATPYWGGNEYKADRQDAISFADYEEARNYQEERRLHLYTYLDFAPFALEDGRKAA